MRPIKYVVKLTDNDVRQLNEILKRRETNTILRRHAQILLDADESHAPDCSRQEVALRSRTTPATVISVIKQFLNEGLDSAVAYHRNPVSDTTRQKVSGADEARLIELACSDAPAGHARWSLSLLEEHAKVRLDVPVKRDAIRRVLKKRN